MGNRGDRIGRGDDHRHIPLTFRKRGGRNTVMTPDGAAWALRPRVDNAMVKALARAFRWRNMLDEGAHATLDDLARARGVHATYGSRVLRLTLLAPEVAEAILEVEWGGKGLLLMTNRSGSALPPRMKLWPR